MQDAAFNRALDMLTGDAPEQRKVHPRRPAGPPKNKHSRSRAADERTSADVLVESIDSTQHPGVTSGAKTLDRSLMILQIAHDHHGVDGLGPSEIAKILTDKFRISTSAAAVSMALGKATNLLNRVSKGKGFEYRIMAPGEEYLAHRDDGGAASPSPKRSPKKKAKTGTKTKSRSRNKATAPTAAVSTKQKSKSTRKSAVKSSRRPGPGAMLRDLVSAGFFSKAPSARFRRTRSILAYTLNELSILSRAFTISF